MAWSWQIGFRSPASVLMESLSEFHDFVNLVIVLVMTFVMVMIFFLVTNSFVNKDFMALQWVEFGWTILPALILLVIATKSLTLLFINEDSSEGAMTCKVTGHQWYWSYEPVNDFSSDIGEVYLSYMISSSSSHSESFRLLDTTNSLVLPVEAPVRLLVTSMDVLHSWTIPSLGVKADCCPGRLNEINFLADRTGLFFGQCSEICGPNHSFMPIEMKITDPHVWMN